MGVFIIAEAGVNHNGSVRLARELVDIAKASGADAVKFQTFKTEKIIGRFASMADYQKKNTGNEESQFDMVKKLEIPYEGFKEIKDYCDKKGIMFLSTPDDTDSLEFLVNLGVKMIKIGSGEVTNLDYLRMIGEKGLPLILSTGMSTLGEVETAINTICRTGNKNITLLHCTTDYPAPYEDVNLKAMITMKKAFGLPVGYSDHTAGFEAAVAAVAMGACIIEKHFTIDKNMEGPDHKASLDPAGLAQFVNYIRNTEMLLGDGIKRPSEREKAIAADVRRSIVASCDLKKGSVISKSCLSFKRPGTGIHPAFIDVVQGRELKRDIKEDEPLTWKDI